MTEKKSDSVICKYRENSVGLPPNGKITCRCFMVLINAKSAVNHIREEHPEVWAECVNEVLTREVHNEQAE